jgi:hypothetical protein
VTRTVGSDTRMVAFRNASSRCPTSRPGRRCGYASTATRSSSSTSGRAGRSRSPATAAPPQAVRGSRTRAGDRRAPSGRNGTPSRRRTRAINGVVHAPDLPFQGRPLRGPTPRQAGKRPAVPGSRTSPQLAAPPERGRAGDGMRRRAAIPASASREVVAVRAQAPRRPNSARCARRWVVPSRRSAQARGGLMTSVWWRSVARDTPKCPLAVGAKSAMAAAMRAQLVATRVISAVAHRRDWPGSSATISNPARASPSTVVQARVRTVPTAIT